ncbi:hypothetical protein DSO57_1014791 [Entomophthora muscae]|uniref:Uncharacterized protein n=1 Tax=Entomophthora muscae TaxID=34485 RepID=A0ACC2UR01_9FUNG|nr:hypothetical protein DSO57_1014791 [Entomophthora muscae]
MKEIPTTPPPPNAPPTQDFSKLGFVYITVLGLANQIMPHNGSWRPLATAVNYLVRIVPIVYMAFQAQPASPVGVQPDSGMGCDTNLDSRLHLCFDFAINLFDLSNHMVKVFKKFFEFSH